MYKNTPLLFCVLITFLTACGEEPEVSSEIDPELLAGGVNFTTFVGGENAFGVQGEELTRDESRLFVAGNSLFRSNWISAPASVMSLDGLGPVFNAISCGSCHFKDGRAAPPDEFSVDKSGLLFRISVDGFTETGEPRPHPVYGAQIQDRSLPAASYEAKVRIDYEFIAGTLDDGTPYELRKPIYTIEDWQYGDVTNPFDLSPRIASQLVGLGLLENIDEDDILALEDVNDSDNDGISGKANYVHDAENGGTTLGRFGWKSNQPSLRQQNAGAFNGDMGLTSDIFPKDDWTETQESQHPEIANGGEPEVSEEQIFRISLYVQSLAVPATRNIDDPQYSSGKQLFLDINCSGCHNPSFQTGIGSSISSLNSQKIAPYTDLLLHDMGPDLADNRPDFEATGTEWRTAPLWGIGLIPAVNDHTRYLHDGRARNLEEAILWHGGEAEESKNKYKSLSLQEREDLLFFIKSI
ncbi:MAG: di-heme oxidoredictase family protein [Bacteroidota bacterium]